MPVFSFTQPELAHAKIRDWQRKKELAFTSALAWLVVKAHRWGLEKKRIVRALELFAKHLDKAGGA